MNVVRKWYRRHQYLRKMLGSPTAAGAVIRENVKIRWTRAQTVATLIVAVATIATAIGVWKQ